MQWKVFSDALREDEAISINVYQPAPTGVTNRRLLERVGKTAQRVHGVREEEIDAMIDEAAGHVRHNPE